MRDIDIAALARTATDFARSLKAVKLRCQGQVQPGWYPYPSFATIDVLDRLLTGENRNISRLIGGHPVLDVGAGDGDVSFLLESVGATVDAIDLPAINYNRMTGIRALRDALNSSVDIRVLDLDSQFTLSRPLYGLVLLFGVLYHLKNPFYVLETLARHCRYCLLSTRIARVGPDRRTRFDPLPLAYLVAERETNNDPTNFWIFSEAGLKRLFERTGWELCDFTTVGCKSNSDPVHARRDERAFCLLRSRRAGDWTKAVQLGDGWHELEEGAWRWTRKVFGVVIPWANAAGIPELTLRFFIPEAQIHCLGKVVLGATVNGIALEPHTYSEAGEQIYQERVPPAALWDEELRVEFNVDRTFTPAGDHRELGILVSFTGECPVVVSRA